MTNHRWEDVRSRIVDDLGGEQVITEAHRRNQAYIDAARLAARRRALGLTQSDIAARMGVTKGRVSQIERGEVSTMDVVSRYIEAMGGRMRVVAEFGDDLMILHGGPDAA